MMTFSLFDKQFGQNSCLTILAMKKLGVLRLVSSIEYFDHLYMYFFISGRKFLHMLGFFHFSLEKGADETVKFGRNCCSLILAIKKLGVCLP